MKLKVILASVNKNRDKETSVTFECDLGVLQEVEAFVDETAIKFQVSGNTEWIVGQVVGTTTSLSGRRFKVICPASENLKTASLSVFCGENMDIELETYQAQ